MKPTVRQSLVSATLLLSGLSALMILAGPAPRTPAAAKRNDSWLVLGPGGGGAQFHPTVSPHDPRTVLVNCDMTGAYISNDGGDSWRMFNLRGVVRFFVFDPSDRNTIYAQTIGLWRSRDAGKTWALVYPAPATVTRVALEGDHAEEAILQRDGPAPVPTALAVDPADSKALFAAAPSLSGWQIIASRDGGQTWSAAFEVAGPVRQILVDPASPRAARKLFLIGANRVYTAISGRVTEGPTAPGEAFLIDVSAGFAPGGELVVYGVSNTAVFVSEDGGGSWRRADFPGSARMSAIATSSFNPNAAYVSYGPFRGAPGREPGDFGVAKTVDRGRTWQKVWSDSNAHPAANVDGGWVTERFGPGWGENPLALGVAPTNPDICYGTDYGRTMRTLDAGKTWRAVNARKLPGGATTTGLDVTTCYGVHFDPFDPAHVLVSYTDIGLMESTDGGASWRTATQKGVPDRWVNTTYWLEFDPAVKGRLWAVMSGTHDLPRPKMWRRMSPGRFGGGVLRSDDGGASWEVLQGGLPATAATHIVLDRRSPAESRVLYVAGFGKGVFKSGDGGKTWSLKNSGIEGQEPFAWRLAEDRDGALYLVAARRSDDDSIGTPNDGALYRSTDGAESWARLALPEGVNGPNGITVDARDPKRLYLAVWARARSGGGGIYLSTDGGTSWKNVLSRDQFIYDVTADPANPSVLYACGFSSSAWRSTDRGETWARIPGYNFKWGHRVIADPHNPGMIYITTFGGSVWYGPAAGDPRAQEDIVTPGLRASGK